MVSPDRLFAFSPAPGEAIVAHARLAASLGTTRRDIAYLKTVWAAINAQGIVPTDHCTWPQAQVEPHTTR